MSAPRDIWLRIADMAAWDGACLRWQGHLNHKGYGYVLYERRQWSIHRLIYTFAYGEIPTGLEIDHLCGVRDCLTLEHLEAVTHRENLARSRTPAAIQRRKARPHREVKRSEPYVPKRLPAHDRVLSRCVPEGDCLVFTGCRDSKNYGRVSLNVNGRERTLLAHRVVYEGLIRPIPDGYAVRHICDNPPCVLPAHLRAEPYRAREESAA